MRWLDSFSDSKDMSLSRLQEIVVEPGLLQSIGSQRTMATEEKKQGQAQGTLFSVIWQPG